LYCSSTNLNSATSITSHADDEWPKYSGAIQAYNSPWCTAHDSLVEPTPDVLLFFFSYFLIQGCFSTSVRASRSSGLYRSSCDQLVHFLPSGITCPLDEVGGFGRNVIGDVQVDLCDALVSGC
jgi:hypothetical protein